jgi:hypothetical protein
MFLECIKKSRNKVEVALHKFIVFFGTINTSKIENEVGLSTITVKIFGLRVDVILKNLVNLDGIVPCLPLLYVVELCTQIFTNKSLGTGY